MEPRSMVKRATNVHDASCIEPGCPSKVYARDRCQKHYNAEYHKTRNRNFYDPNRGHAGLVRGVPKGWGAIS
jgi:hypothetical protein